MITLEKLARIAHGSWSPAAPVGTVGRVSTDSRSLGTGDLFFAIRGEKFDGNRFLPDVVKRGAVAAVVDGDVPGKLELPILRVQDSVEALAALAREHRKTLRGTVIAITGSNGKTTTKDMVHHVLAKGARAARSQKSFNNHIGVPLTLLSAAPGDDFVVVEVGTNHPGEIARLAALVRASIAVVTNVAESHLGGLGSVEGVAKEKEALVEALPPGGIAVLNVDNEHVRRMAERATSRTLTFGMFHEADLRGSRVEAHDGQIRFWVNDRVEFVLPMLGGWNAYNALAAAAVALQAGVALEETAARLADFRPSPMRMEPVEIAGVRFVNDAYNANPASTLLALDQFDVIEAEGRKIVVLGEMRELGDHAARLHARVGERVGRMKVDLFVAVGREMAAAAEAAHKAGRPVEAVMTADEAAEALLARLRPGDLVLLKGSRAVGLERVLERLRAGHASPREAACSPPSSRPI
ncbi:MAG: UDP-N-acetylmuramoyl-tripeptide--D-alanyl-D-alanine ligase [Planctomycetota bacterium]